MVSCISGFLNTLPPFLLDTLFVRLDDTLANRIAVQESRTMFPRKTALLQNARLVRKPGLN
jgi:hypothetical protein